jgi:hypothetical protein
MIVYCLGAVEGPATLTGEQRREAFHTIKLFDYCITPSSYVYALDFNRVNVRLLEHNVLGLSKMQDLMHKFLDCVPDAIFELDDVQGRCEQGVVKMKCRYVFSGEYVFMRAHEGPISEIDIDSEEKNVGKQLINVSGVLTLTLDSEEKINSFNFVYQF